MPNPQARSAVAGVRDRLVGPMTALVTPFRVDGSLDLDAVDVHVRYQLEHQVTVIVACGTIGEFPSLSLEERRRMVERSASAVAGRAVVLAGVSDSRQETILELAHHAHRAGVDGLLLMAPPFFRLNEREQLDYWTWVDSNLELPFVVYSTTANPSGLPSFALLEQLKSMPHFAGLKEASADVSRFHQLIRLFGGSFPIVAAVEAPLPYTLLAGAVGLMTSTACFAPALTWDLFRAAKAGDVRLLLSRFEPISRFRQLFQPRMDAGFPVYIPFTKAACELIGLPSGDPRPPLASVTVAERQALASVLHDDFGLVTQRWPEAEGVNPVPVARP